MFNSLYFTQGLDVLSLKEGCNVPSLDNKCITGISHLQSEPSAWVSEPGRACDTSSQNIYIVPLISRAGMLEKQKMINMSRLSSRARDHLYREVGTDWTQPAGLMRCRDWSHISLVLGPEQRALSTITNIH